jgi:hypothetical protein
MRCARPLLLLDMVHVLEGGGIVREGGVRRVLPRLIWRVTPPVAVRRTRRQIGAVRVAGRLNLFPEALVWRG